MNYFYYLKQQVYVYLMLVLVAYVSYHISLYYEFRKPVELPLEVIIAYSITFIVGRAFVRFLNQDKTLDI